MKRLKTLAVAMGIAALSITAVGCGDVCDEVLDHWADCGIPTSPSDAEADCSDEAATVAECQLELSCDELTNIGTPGHSAFGSCLPGQR